MQDIILLIQVFLEVLIFWVHRNGSAHPHPPLSPRNPLSFFKMNKALLLPTTRVVGGDGSWQSQEHALSSPEIGTIWGSTWPEDFGPSPEMSPGRGSLGPGRTHRLLDGVGEVLNSIAQGKGKDNQTTVLLMPPYWEAGLGEAMGSQRQQADGAGRSRGGAAHPGGSQELQSRVCGLAHGSLGVFQGAKSV